MAKLSRKEYQKIHSKLRIALDNLTDMRKVALYHLRKQSKKDYLLEALGEMADEALDTQNAIVSAMGVLE